MRLAVDSGLLEGDLVMPDGARGVVVFAHGSGSSRHSSRNKQVASVLRAAGFGTLLFDLLTASEEEGTRALRFDIALLGERLVAVTDALADDVQARGLPVGYFGASTGAAAALVAAAARPAVRAVVSRGGRPDLAGDALSRVAAPVLLIVGSLDREVLGLNRLAQARLSAPNELVIVPGATHLFEEPGTLDEVARLAVQHFSRYLKRSPIQPIRSRRLDLVSLSPELLDAFLAGDRAAARTLVDFAIPEEFPGDALDLVRFRRVQIAERPAWLPWSLRAVILREPERVMIGYANFHGPPGVNDLGVADAAETGYTIFAAHRGHGFATELAQAMMDWAAREHGVRHFISGVAPDNAPSLRVNEKLGFVRTGDIVDGEIIFELRRS